MRSTWYFVSIVICLSSGCASHKKLAEHTEFKTRITESGLKHFQIKLRSMPNKQTPHSLPPTGAGGNRMAPSRRPPGLNPKRIEKNLIKVLDEKLLENQYCREGYWLLDRNFMPQSTYLRGECNETATEADRKAFPDTLTHW